MDGQPSPETTRCHFLQEVVTPGWVGVGVAFKADG